jgi:hypothetical protein
MAPLTDRSALILTCSASAGAHAALTPHHLSEARALGASFAAAAVALAVVAVWLEAHRPPRAAFAAAALLLAGLIAAYGATRIAAVPPLTTAPEPVDTGGALTKLVELAGLLFALRLLINREARRIPRAFLEKGVPS